ncbi:MAG: site-specific integrase, partial [Pirellulales bacterium]|nr:site-specific integrase [Pirellulales bacterium]
KNHPTDRKPLSSGCLIQQRFSESAERGKRRTKKGFTDKGLTEELAGKLESEARLRSSGMIDPLQDKLAEQKQVPIANHLAAFEESLGENTGKHVKLTMTRVRKIVEGGEIGGLGDIEPETVQAFLRKFRKDEDLGHRTYNHYLQAMDAFCNWCVVTKRLIANPILGLERLNTAVDVRHARRALTGDEVARLVESARKSGVLIQRYNGEQRARIYFVSYMTGLRKKELASLTPRSFDLDAATPTVTVEAACSKHRRKDVLPLHPELVAKLRVWLKGLKPADKLFPRLDRRKTWLMVKKDLERVGIPYENEDGIADFHASGRHTYITQLLRHGATLPEAKELARHSDVNMTMKYTHIGLNDQAKAVANLPAPARDKAEPAARPALHWRCNFGGAARLSLSLDGNGRSKEKRQSPCRDKDFDVRRRSMSSSGKVEAAGIEPSNDFSATGLLPCGCVICEECRAALALQNWRPEWLEVAFDDADLQRVVESWDAMPGSVRRAIVGLAESIK